MFAVICIPNFALQAALRHEPLINTRLQSGGNEGVPRPVALVDASPQSVSKAVVLECTEAARATGVCAGLTVPQAMARCRDLIVLARSTSAEQNATEILLQTADAFSPHVENTAPGVCTIDLRGLNFGNNESPDHEPPTAHHEPNLFASTAENDHSPQQNFDFFQSATTASPSPLNGGRAGVRSDRAHALDDDKSPEEWCRSIITALRQCGLEAQVGVATTPNLALFAARAATPVLLIERAEEFFHSLPSAALEPTPPVLEVLKRWGIHTAGAFLALGKDAIAERLGAEALELFARANAQTIRPLNIVVPPDTFAEQMDFEAQIETLEPLLFVLRRFVEQLATRIALTYRVVSELHLRLTLESGAAYERTFKVPAPTAKVETLFRMLHTHLENLRTDAPITSLRLSAIPCRTESQQFGLFESALRDPNHFHETLARLTALLGHEHVGTPVAEATHRPDTFRMEVPRFEKNETKPKPNSGFRNPNGLCLRRFRPALHAEVQLEQGRPVFLSTLLVSGPVQRVRGPWCLSGTWWDQRRWARQEWDVELRDGVVYRLFQSEGNWLVEGVYD